jgi:hypothetical protein
MPTKRTTLPAWRSRSTSARNIPSARASLSTLGLAGATLVLADALLVLFGVVPQLSVWALLALPVAAYEMILAVWLIVKGFSSSAAASASAGTATNELPSAT